MPMWVLPATKGGKARITGKRLVVGAVSRIRLHCICWLQCLPVLNVLSCHLHSVHCMPVDRLVLLELCILAALAWQGLRRGPQQQSHAPPGLHWEAQVYGIQYIFCIMHILHIFNHQLRKNLRFQSFPNNLSKMTCTLLSVATLEKPESRSQDQVGPNTRKYCSRKMCRGTTLATNNA